jgi:hypothetical protein
VIVSGRQLELKRLVSAERGTRSELHRHQANVSATSSTTWFESVFPQQRVVCEPDLVSGRYAILSVSDDGGRVAGLNRWRLSFGGCGEAALARAIDGT